MNPKYVDVHSHLTFKDYDQDLEEVLGRMRDEEVWTITVGVNKATSKASVDFSEGKEGFFATVGLHPNDTIKKRFQKTSTRSLCRTQKSLA